MNTVEFKPIIFDRDSKIALVAIIAYVLSPLITTGFNFYTPDSYSWFLIGAPVIFLVALIYPLSHLGTKIVIEDNTIKFYRRTFLFFGPWKKRIFDLNSTQSFYYDVELEVGVGFAVNRNPGFKIQMKNGSLEKFSFRGWDSKTVRQVLKYIKDKYPHIETRAETWASEIDNPPLWGAK